jgi:hypothetical protein
MGNLVDNTRFESAVRRLNSTDHHVSVELETGEVRSYKGVIIATGMHRTPRLPFGVRLREGVLHSVSYRYARPDLLGRRIVIVGGGNSAAAIADDLVGHADSIVLVMPEKGTWFLPRHVRAIPTDLYPLSLLDTDALKMQKDLASDLVNGLVGALEDYGLRTPKYLPFEHAPIVGLEILEHLLTGRLSIAYGFVGMSGKSVETFDGSVIPADYVIFATGYNEHEIFSIVDSSGFGELYLQSIYRRDPRIAFIGDLRSDIGGFWVFDLVSRMIAGHLRCLLKDGRPGLALDAGIDLSGGGRFASGRWQRPFVYGRTFVAAISEASDVLGVKPPESDLMGGIL